MSTNVILALEEQFKKDCTIIDLKYEYPNYTGQERYAIVSELTQVEIEANYTEQIQNYIPFVKLGKEFLKIRNDFIKNEDKYRKRMKDNNDAFGYEDGEMEMYHEELFVPDFSLSYVCYDHLKELLNKLPKQQLVRINQYFFEDKTIIEIAEIEGVSFQAISKSLTSAIKTLRKFWLEG